MKEPTQCAAAVQRPRDWGSFDDLVGSDQHGRRSVKSGRMIDWKEARSTLAVLLDLKGDRGGLARLDELLSRHGQDQVP